MSTALDAQFMYIFFTGRDTNNRYVQLDSVRVTNISQGWQSTLYWPDTLLRIIPSPNGIEDYEMSGTIVQLLQNTPNPFIGTTSVTLNIKEEGEVNIEMTDLAGRLVGTYHKNSMQPGAHFFRISAASTGIYFLTAQANGQSSSIKMISHGHSGKNLIEYGGYEDIFHQNDPGFDNKGIINNTFHIGDQMEYVGYATVSGAHAESFHLLEEPSYSHVSQLMFAATIGMYDGQPCPNVKVLTDYDGNQYNTVQIGNQCWMRENLRTTHYANGASIPLGPTTLSATTAYRYYPNNDSTLVSTHGYLYNWIATLHGPYGSDSNPSGLQGICPNNWHVPSEAEWLQMINYASTQNAYICGTFYGNTAKAFASQTGWNSNYYDTCTPGYDMTSNNATNFSAYPIGFLRAYGNTDSCNFVSPGTHARFWTTTETCNNHIITYSITNNLMMPTNPIAEKWDGYSVRCVHD